MEDDRLPGMEGNSALNGSGGARTRIGVFDPLDNNRGRCTDVPMSECLVDSSHDLASAGGELGLRFRGAMQGPERDLLAAFVDSATIQLRPGRSLTVFVEPA